MCLAIERCLTKLKKGGASNTLIFVNNFVNNLTIGGHIHNVFIHGKMPNIQCK